MTTRNRFRRLAAAAAVSALPLAGASALITAQPAAAQFFPTGNPFLTNGFVPSGVVPFGGAGINFHPDNSTTEVNNFGNGNTTLIDDTDGSSWDNSWGGGWNHNWDFPWWHNNWDWNPGWGGGGGGWW
jgi:hypothetical protein